MEQLLDVVIINIILIIQCIYNIILILINRIPISFEEDNTECIIVYNPSEKVCVSVDLYKDDQSKSPKEQLKKFPKAVFKLNDCYFWVDSVPLISLPTVISKGSYFIVPATFDPQECAICIDIYTDKPIKSSMIVEKDPVICSRLLRLDADLLYRQSFLYLSNSKLEKVSISTNGNTKEENEEIELLRKQLYCSLGENMELNKKLNLMSQDQSLFNRKSTNTATSVMTLKAQLIDALSKIDDLNEQLEKKSKAEKIITPSAPAPPPLPPQFESELLEKNKKIKDMENELSELREKNELLKIEMEKQKLVEKQQPTKQDSAVSVEARSPQSVTLIV